MRVDRVTLEQTGHFSKLFLDYLDQDKNLLSFYSYPPDLTSFSKTIKDLSDHKFNRQLLVDVVAGQYSAAQLQTPRPNGLAGRADSRLQTLLDEKTFTVCTGHQLCLFTGPLYFIYKIISTINLAEALKKKYPDYNFIPVYWMASEDHDFEEVNHANVFGKKLEWKNKQGGAVGKYGTRGISELVSELGSLLGDSANAKELISLFENAYQKHENYADATRFLVNELFGQYGLLIVDGNDARLKAEFTEVMSDDLFKNTVYSKVTKTITELEKSGYKTQVNPRNINLFYLSDNQRNRIDYLNNYFNIIDSDKKLTESEMKEELKSHPERFSPNVVTRPLYQQKILPNLAYVGGPAEIGYWLEYKAMFDHYRINFPVLVPRNFVMLIDEAVAEKLQKLGLEKEDVFLPANEMIVKYISSISGDKVSFNAEREQLNKQYKSIEEKLALVDKSLPSAAGAELKRQLNALDALEKKMIRAFKKKNEEAVNQITRLREKLFPGDVLQERHENFIPYYLKHGKEFISELKNALDPFDKRFIILSEK